MGVFDGGTSQFLLKSFPNLKLISIDPYRSYYEYDQARLNKAEQIAISRLQDFGERSVRIKDTSVNVASHFPDNSVDFVFIDADHTYDAVKKDLELWYPKVRAGGLFSGHDYRWDDVTRAVNEFSEVMNLNGFFSPKESDLWWFQKKV